MSAHGWYPDPSGQPGQFRYWNGQTWSAETTDRPQETPAPNAPGTDRGARGSSRTALIAVVAVLVVGLVVWLIAGAMKDDQADPPIDTNTSTPSVSGWDETSTPTPSDTPSSPDPSGSAAVVACPPAGSVHQPSGAHDGLVIGGGVSFPAIDGWEDTGGWGLDWTDDRNGQRLIVTSDWAAIAVVGQIPRERQPDPRTAARQLMSCMASSHYYPSLTKRTDGALEAVTIDGAKGWKLTSQLEVENRTVRGDSAVIVVLDTGNPDTFSIFASTAPLDHSDAKLACDIALKGVKLVR